MFDRIKDTVGRYLTQYQLWHETHWDGLLVGAVITAIFFFLLWMVGGC